MTPHRKYTWNNKLQLVYAYYKVGMGSCDAHSLGSLRAGARLGRIPLPSPPFSQEDGPPHCCLPLSCLTAAALQQMDHQFTNSQQFIVIIKGIIWDPKEFFYALQIIMKTESLRTFYNVHNPINIIISWNYMPLFCWNYVLIKTNNHGQYMDSKDISSPN